MAFYFAAFAIFIVNPALNTLAHEVYPDIAYSSVLLIATLASLSMIPGSLMSGAVIGKRIRFKTMAIISLLFIIVGGVMPYFLTNFYAVLGMRVIVGLGIGFAFPIQNTIVAKLFSPERAPTILGIGSCVMAFGGIVYQLAAGYVTTINPNYVWLVHGLLIISLLLVIAFLPEPPEEVSADLQAHDATGGKTKMPGRVYFTSIGFGILFLAFYPMLLNMAAILMNEELGTAATAGSVLSIFTLGGAVAGFVFGRVFKLTKNYVVPLGLLCLAGGTGLFCVSHTLPLIIAATALVGVGVQWIWPGTLNGYSAYVPSQRLGMASALFISGMNLGCFLSSSFIAAVAQITDNPDPRLPVIAGFWIVLAYAAAWAFLEIKKPLVDY